MAGSVDGHLGNLGYSRNCKGSNINENMRAGDWSRAWARQMERWGDAPLGALGVDGDQLRSVVFPLKNTDGETMTGEDMTLMLLVSLPERSYCSVVNVQFKRPVDDEKSINVDNKGWRQFDTLVKLENASGGRWKACHALFRNVENGLATIPAVAASLSRKVLSRQPGVALSPEQGKQPSRVPWEQNGDALPTALANALCNAASFATVEQAFVWMKSQNELNLPDYMVIQGIGDDPWGLLTQWNMGLIWVACRAPSTRSPTNPYRTLLVRASTDPAWGEIWTRERVAGHARDSHRQIVLRAAR
jgi:hypothetical protein